MSDDPRELLEQATIKWRRDWDALLLGFVIGALLVWGLMQ